MGGVGEAAALAAVVAIGTTAYTSREQRKQAQNAREDNARAIAKEKARKQQEELRSLGLAEAKARRVQQRAGEASQTDLTNGTGLGTNAGTGGKSLLGL